MDAERVVVLDNGGSSCKIGMAGSAEPYRHAHSHDTIHRPLAGIADNPPSVLPCCTGCSQTLLAAARGRDRALWGTRS